MHKYNVESKDENDYSKYVEIKYLQSDENKITGNNLLKFRLETIFGNRGQLNCNERKIYENSFLILVAFKK